MAEYAGNPRRQIECPGCTRDYGDGDVLRYGHELLAFLEDYEVADLEAYELNSD